MKRLRRSALALCAVVIAGVLVGTLTPMPYHRTPPNAAFVEGYRYLSWEFTTIRDMAGNLLLFVPVGFALWIAAVFVVRRSIATPLAWSAAVALSVVIEWTQVFIPGRYPCASDVLMNAIGAVVGVGAASLAHSILGAIIFRTQTLRASRATADSKATIDRTAA